MRHRVLPGLGSRRPMPGRNRPHVRRDERGAAAVEAALLVPVLALFFLGMVDLGLFMRSNVEVTTVARDGALVASSEPLEASLVKDTVEAIARSASPLGFDELEVTIYKATDDPNPPDSCSSQCVHYSARVPSGVSRPLDPSDFVKSGGLFDPNDLNACLSDDQADYVGVYVQARHDWLFDLVGSDPTLVTGRTVMKFEPITWPTPDDAACKSG